MSASWTPIIIVDIFGSVWVLFLALCCACLSRKWSRQKSDDIFRDYIFLLTLAIVFFAISRSFGHLAKQVLLLNDMADTWNKISPFSGAINSVTFVVIFAFGLYFHRIQKVHMRMEEYKNNLEEMISRRTVELQVTNATLENVLDSSNPLCITGCDRMLLKVNRAYQAIWPVDVTDGVKCCDNRPGMLCDTQQCPLQRIMAGEEEVYHETSKIINGEPKVFIVSARPYRDAGGEVVGIVESFQDISKRKQAELALASEKERLAVTLRSIGDGVITTDLSGNVALINRITEQLTGWSQQEAVGKPVEKLFNIVHEKTGKPCKSPVDEVLATGEMVALTDHIALIAKDGTRYSIKDSGAPIFNQDGDIIGAVLVFRDVTSDRRIKEELLKAQKLESIGVLAGGIAHDFNNILAVILGNVELAGMHVDPEKDVSSILSNARKATLRAKDLTQQLLTFAKGGDPIRKTTSVKETITESANFILHGSPLSCQFFISDDLWLVDVDSGQIGQVIQNLVLNAQAAMPERGEIRISGVNVEVNSSGRPALLSDEKSYIAITVADDGYGIDEEDLESIFDPYFSTKQGGSGLGLAITHSIITKHQGHIDVESRLGEGTSVTFYLPVSGKQVLSVPVAEVHGGKKMRAKILLMDDEEPVQKIASLMLGHLGHEVLLAASGEEAIEIFNEHRQTAHPVDVTIMDLTVPGAMGGKDAVQEILKIDPDARVIVSSGYSNDPVMANAERFGFQGAISKPFSIDQLNVILRKVLLK